MTSKTSEQLRQEARESEAKRDESFERCDTDGFLSQWAHGITAQQKRLEAEIVDNGGEYEFATLVDIETGREIVSKVIDGKFGTCWVVSDDEAERLGRKFIPYDGSHRMRDLQPGEAKPRRSRVQADLGLVQELRYHPAKAIIAGSGTGLSGQAWAQAIRTDTPKGRI